jgi:hypothetical protein
MFMLEFLRQKWLPDLQQRRYALEHYAPFFVGESSLRQLQPLAPGLLAFPISATRRTHRANQTRMWRSAINARHHVFRQAGILTFAAKGFFQLPANTGTKSRGLRSAWKNKRLLESQ